VIQHSFASDNYAGAHPEVLAAVADANAGHVSAYGADPVTAEAVRLFRRHLGEHVEVAMVFNGTGANVVGLGLLLRPWQHVLCARSAHIAVDEGGAPERVLGVKLVDLDTPDGKLTPDLLRSAAVATGSEHNTQPGAVSISQSTELGTCYTPEEIRALADVAHGLGLYLHMDGARVANAAASLGVSLREITTDCGVDVLSFGGTKNGGLGAEAVVVLRAELVEPLRFVRKQVMQLGSKMRFLSAQFVALLREDLWYRNAAHANAMAARLHDAVLDAPGLVVTRPRQANVVFATVPAAAIEPLQQASPFYEWDPVTHEVRWMCSWDTTEAHVDAFAAAVHAVLGDLAAPSRRQPAGLPA